MRFTVFIAIWVFTATLLPAATLRDVESVHYRIHTDLDPQLTADLAQRLDVMYEQYAARLADLQLHTNKKFEVYLFGSHQDYTDFTGNAMPNSGGMFLPGKAALASFLQGQGRDVMRRTLQHEAFHQFASIAFKDRLPIWLNEGIAQVYEEGIWTGRQLMLGEVPPRRMRQLQADMENQRLLPFGQFMALDGNAWRNDMADLATGASRYNQAWAMTHFLIFATDPAGKPAYRQRLIDMLDDMRHGRGGSESFLKNFGNNLGGFQQRFQQFAESLSPTPAAIYVEHQSVLADLMIECAAHQAPPSDVSGFEQLVTQRQVQIRYTTNGLSWTTDAPTAYFKDLSGRQFNDAQLRFAARGGSSLPDLLCMPTESIALRTIFHETGGKPDFETIVRTP